MVTSVLVMGVLVLSLQIYNLRLFSVLVVMRVVVIVALTLLRFNLMIVSVVVTVVATSMSVTVVVFTAKVVMTVTLVENLDLDQVKDQAQHSHNDHSEALNVWLLPEPLRCFDHEPDGHDPHSGDRYHRSNDFSAMPTVR